MDKDMAKKTLTALFAILALGVLVVGHSPAGTGKASVETAAAQGMSQASMVRLAALLPSRRARNYSTPSTVIEIKCKKSGGACTINSQCCSNKCCTDDFEICEGWYGKCT